MKQLWCNVFICRQAKPRGFIATGVSIVRRETPLALYKGLGAVLSGIVPKMAIRFASFETYKKWLTDKETGKASVWAVFSGAYYPRREFDHNIVFVSSWLGCGYNGSRCSGNTDGGR